MNSLRLLPWAILAIAIPSALSGADLAADAAWKKVQNAMNNVKSACERKTSDPQRCAMAFKSFDAAMGEFLAKAPDDSRRWEAKFFDADYTWLRQRAGLRNVVNPMPAYDEILNAPDADAVTKGNASAAKVLRMWSDLRDARLTASEWAKMADAHLQAYPNCDRNARINGCLPVARAAEAALSKPLDLKFTAVDGSEIDLAKMRGKVVLLYFWTLSQPSLEADISKVLGTHSRQNPKGFEVIGIACNFEKMGLKNFLKRKGIPWPHYCDGANNDLNRQLGTVRIPSMWLVDKKGMIVHTNARENLEQEVIRLLAE